MNHSKIDLEILLKISEITGKKFFSPNSSRLEECRDQIFDHLIDLYLDSKKTGFKLSESYCWKVAINQACTCYRKINKRSFVGNLDYLVASYPTENSLLDQIHLSILANSNDIDGEIINLLAEGYKRKEICKELKIVPSTLNTRIDRNRGTKWKL